MATLPEGREPLIRYLTVQARLDRELAAVLREAAGDTFRRLLRARNLVQVAQLLELTRDIRALQLRMWVEGIAPAIAERLPDVEKAADRAARALDAYAAGILGERRARALRGTLTGQLERGLRIDASRVPQRLSELVYRNAALTSGRIERIIRSAIVRGQSAREMAEQVRSSIDPAVRGGVAHAAMRLGRTELNNAFHERQKLNADRDWVTGAKWNLSKSHPKPDACDLLAAHDEGLGRGVWAKGTIPDKPHPQCMCYVTYELMAPDQVVQLIAAQAI